MHRPAAPPDRAVTLQGWALHFIGGAAPDPARLAFGLAGAGVDDVEVLRATLAAPVAVTADGVHVEACSVATAKGLPTTRHVPAWEMAVRRSLTCVCVAPLGSSGAGSTSQDRLVRACRVAPLVAQVGGFLQLLDGDGPDVSPNVAESVVSALARIRQRTNGRSDVALPAEDPTSAPLRAWLDGQVDVLMDRLASRLRRGGAAPPLPRSGSVVWVAHPAAAGVTLTHLALLGRWMMTTNGDVVAVSHLPPDQVPVTPGAAIRLTALPPDLPWDAVAHVARLLARGGFDLAGAVAGVAAVL